MILVRRTNRVSATHQSARLLATDPHFVSLCVYVSVSNFSALFVSFKVRCVYVAITYIHLQEVNSHSSGTVIDKQGKSELHASLSTSVSNGRFAKTPSQLECLVTNDYRTCEV